MQAKTATFEVRTATFVMAIIVMAAWLAITPMTAHAAPKCHAEFMQIALQQHGLTPKDVHDALESEGLNVETPGQTMRLTKEGGIEVYDANRGHYFGCLDLDAK